MRIFSSFGHSPGNTCFQFRFSRRQISTPRFSDVGTIPAAARKRRDLAVQVAVVERQHHFPPHQLVQHTDVHRPARRPVAAARARSLPPRSYARGRTGLLHLPYKLAILFLAQLTGMQAVRGSESVPPGYAEHAGSPK